MELFILAILLFAAGAAWKKSERYGSMVLLIFSILHLIFGGYFFAQVMQLEEGTVHLLEGKFLPMALTFDRESGFFLLIEAVVLMAVAVYNIDFVRRAEEQLYRGKSRIYHASIIGFIGAMDLALLSYNFGMMWVFLELSTLLSALLIAHHASAHAYEATWKYVFICSIGIAFAFTGVIFLLISSGGELNMADMLDLKAFPLKLALPFLIIGFGTKVGLAPVHNWLPDAHSEAPSPVSALLSAALLNSAMLVIYRVIVVCNRNNAGEFAGSILLLMGFLSLFIPGIFIFKAVNYKRMLAYSSIENMGISAIALAIGCQSGFFIQIAGHSLIKCALFLSAGNILSLYGTKAIEDVRGLLKRDRMVAATFWFGILGIIGGVPFMLFAGEFLIMLALFQKNMVLCIIFILLLTLIVYGMIKNSAVMLTGEISVNKPVKLSYAAKLPPLILLILAMLGLAAIFMKWSLVYA